MSIYKECDIRGVYGKDFGEETACSIGRALGTKLTGQSVVVGGDARTSTPSLSKQLIEGLVASGVNVIDIGLIPTPLIYFAKKVLKTEGAVMVTASHNPEKYNGFKITIGDWPIKPEELKELEDIIAKKEFVSGSGIVKKYSIEGEYADFILPLVKPKRKLKVVIDACNGAASELAPQLFKEAGHDVVELYCSYDGTFPNRNPNPAVYSNLGDLQDRVVKEKADLGVAFDGDGDRVIFVDDTGRYCESERSFVVIIEEYLKDKKSSVVYDGKSSSVVKNCITRLASKAIIERSGHAFIKRTFLENGSELAGEISGHLFFKELGFDDGLYGALKMAEILSRKNIPLSSIMDSIEKTVITPDLRIGVGEKELDQLFKDLEKWEEKYPVSRLDGIRIEFPSGWVLVRRSVTEPVITIRLEAKTVKEAKAISKSVFEENFSVINKVVLESL